MDDNAVVLGALVDLLSEQSGIEVVGAYQEVEAALAGAGPGRPELAIVDADLIRTSPGLPGRLRALAPQILVMGASSRCNEGLVEAMAKLEADGCLDILRLLAQLPRLIQTVQARRP